MIFRSKAAKIMRISTTEVYNQDQYLDGKLFKPGYDNICLHQF